MGTRANPDGTTTFISIDPGVRGFEFNAPATCGVYTRLRLQDPQHIYEYESQGEASSGPGRIVRPGELEGERGNWSTSAPAAAAR